MKKLLGGVLLLGIVLLSGQGSIRAESFVGREDEMNKKCSVIYDSKTQAECARYKDYLKDKSNKIDDEIGSIQKDIDATQGDINKVITLLNKHKGELDNYESQIANIQGIIDTTQASIDTLNGKIEEKSSNIEKRDKLMRKQMQSSQSALGLNQYIDFLMGANDFSDLIRRSQALGKLQQYERKEIALLADEKKDLANDKKVVEEHKSLLELQKEDVNNKKAKVVALNTANESLLAQFQKSEASLLNEKRSAQMAQASIPKIDLSIADSFDKEEPSTPSTPEQPDSGGSQPDSGSGGSQPGGGGGGTTTPPSGSTSFIAPLQYGWHYEAGTWQYPGGGGHMGMDFSTGRQTGIPVVAPADGIVIWSYNGGCNNNGYSTCGVPYMGGNNTLLLTKKGNTIYAMPFYHLTSATKSAGTKVSQGEVIGYSGNSGNSTGPHTHVEVIRVGAMSMSDALSIYNRTGDVTFGTGWNADAPRACGSAPCRERPENYWL